MNLRETAAGGNRHCRHADGKDGGSVGDLSRLLASLNVADALVATGGKHLAGHCGELFRRAVQAILARHLDGRLLAAGLCAYDSGMARGLYGQRAAISVGLHGRYISVGAACEGAQGVLELILRSGEHHGGLIRREWTV